ncbi:hypothetical protein ABPG74_014390 [Tetrahymena malaccensis]
MQDQQKSQQFSQTKDISQFQFEKDLFQKTYTNMPWKSYRMYNNVEKENNFLYKKIVDISAKDVQNEITLKEQKYELKQNNQLLVRVKKRQQNSAKITEENRRMFVKLYTQKPHINSHQQQQDYQQKKQIIKRLTRFPLSNSKCINNPQGSQESIKIHQSFLPGNKSFIQQDTKYEEIVNEINQEEFQGMRDSLRDGSYKLINFSTKDHNIMAQRPSSSCLQKSSQKNIQTAQKHHLNIQQIQNLIKNHINTDTEKIPPKPKIVQKRAQSAMRTTRYKQPENQMLFVPTHQYPNITDDIQKQRIEECHTTKKQRSDSFRQRKLSLPDSQQLQQFQFKEEDEEQEIDYEQQKEFSQIAQQYEQIKNEKIKSKDNLQKQMPQIKYQKGDSLNYSQSNINSINYQQFIEQRHCTQPEQSTITINQILKQQNSYQKNHSISASKYNCKDLSANREANSQISGSIQVKSFFEEEKGINKQKFYYRNDLKHTEQSPGLRSSQDINEIYKQSQTQPIYQNGGNSLNYSYVQNKNFERSIGQASNKNKNQEIYLEQLENQNNQIDQNEIYSDKSTIKTKKFDQINQRMTQIVQQKNVSQYVREQQQFTTMDNKKRNYEQDFEQSPTIRKYNMGVYYLNSCNKNNDSAEKSARKSYQQKILNGKSYDQQESFSFNLANLNQLNKQEQAERKNDCYQVSFRKKSLVSNSLNNNSIDNSINFLKMNVTQNKTNQHLKQDDIAFQQIYDLPMSKRVNEQEQYQIQANVPQSINQNYDEKSTINHSKNPHSYVLPELSQRKDKTKKNI